MNLTLRSTLGALLASGALMAAMTPPAAAQQPATVTCEDPRVDRTACYREAAAAQEAKRQGTLNSPGGYEQNAMKRCQRQPEGSAREACMHRVKGSAGHTTTTGSVKGGGKMHRHEMHMPAQEAAPKQQ
jgi:hypothetical protein